MISFSRCFLIGTLIFGLTLDRSLSAFQYFPTDRQEIKDDLFSEAALSLASLSVTPVQRSPYGFSPILNQIHSSPVPDTLHQAEERKDPSLPIRVLTKEAKGLGFKFPKVTVVSKRMAGPGLFISIARSQHTFGGAWSTGADYILKAPRETWISFSIAVALSGIGNVFDLEVLSILAWLTFPLSYWSFHGFSNRSALFDPKVIQLATEKLIVAIAGIGVSAILEGGPFWLAALFLAPYVWIIYDEHRALQQKIVSEPFVRTPSSNIVIAWPAAGTTRIMFLFTRGSGTTIRIDRSA